MTQIDFQETEPEFVIHRARQNAVDVQTVKATTDNLRLIVEWIEDSGHHAVLGDGQLTIQSTDGPATVRPGDQVIYRKGRGFGRCDAETFAEDYGDFGPVES